MNHLIQANGLKSKWLVCTCLFLAGLFPNLIAQPCNLLGNDTLLCSGQTLVLDAGAGAISYAWSTGASSQTIFVNSANTYFVQVNSGAGICNDTLVVSFSPSPIAGIFPSGSPNLCFGDSLLFTASGGINFQWLMNQILIPGATDDSLMAVSPGDYAVIVNGPGNCPDSSLTYSVTWFPPFNPVVTAPDTFLCPGDSLVLSASSGNSYQWFLNSLPLPGASSSQLVVTGPGTYVVQVTNSNGCTEEDTLQIYNGGNPTVEIISSSDTTCENQFLFLVASGAQTYQWLSNGFPIAGANDSLYAATAGGNYSVIGYTSCGSDTSSTINIFAWPAAFADFSFLQFPGYEVHFFDQSQNPVNWQWYFQADSSFLQNPKYEFPGTGVYPVTLWITDSRGCRDSITLQVEVVEDSVEIPNVFSPNGDGVNDFLAVKTGLVIAGTFTIVDRWGKLVFSTSLEEPQSWNGLINNSHKSPEGVYFYFFEGRGPEGKTESRAGYITLIR